MYLDYYSLVEEPFSVTADPKFLYLSEGHEEAQAHLLYAIRKQRGFVCITGGVGTGKTMLLNSLLTTVDEGFTFAFIYQSANDITELLRYVFKDLGIEDKGYTTKSEQLTVLNDFLLQEMEQNRNVVLVIDEAQNLGVSVLEDLRLISNLETSKKKLIQIVLAGQSELAELLARQELRQLNQRIALRYHLGSMSEQETAEYIWHRLKIAGSPRDDLFDNEAVRAIYQFTHGIPRLINQVCDTALLKGFLRKKPVIDGQTVADVIASEFSHRKVETSIESDLEEEQPAEHDTVKPLTVAEPHQKAAPITRRSSRMGVWLALAVIIVVGGFTIWRIWFQYPDIGFTPLPQDDAYAGETERTVEVINSDSITEELSAATAEVTTAVVKEQPPTPIRAAPAQPTVANDRTELESAPVVTGNKTPASALSQEVVIDATGGKRIRIRRGDRLFILMQQEYDCVTEPVLQRIMAANPRITNPNLIRIGDFLYLPKLSDSDLASWRLLPSLM